MAGKFFKNLREAKKWQKHMKDRSNHDYRIYKWKRGITNKYFVGTYYDWLEH